MSRKVKGMVQLAGITYRIVRVAAGSYSVVRISDDLDVGSFHLAPQLGIEARNVDSGVLREVARLAIHTAKTSYVGFPRPELPSLPVAAMPTASMPAASTIAARRPSSMPPPVPHTN